MRDLSEIAFQVEGQPMFAILDKAQRLEREGRSILHFELGEPDFDTPKNIIQAACEAIKTGETHYTSSMGLYDFRLAVQETTALSRGFAPALDQILVTPGANSIIYLAIKCVVNPGEEVIVPDPGFPTYFSAIKACGAVPVTVPLKEENDFRLNPDDLREKITDKTKMIIINSPSNPTGAVMSELDIKAVSEIAQEYGIYLLSDEIYGRLIFNENSKFLSPSYLDKCKERTIIINGFSKAFAMTGWRLGVAIGPKLLIEKMGLLVSTIVSCVPPFIQRAGIEAIKGDQTQVKMMKVEYDKRRKVLVDGLNSLPGVSCVMPTGAIYAFPNIQGTGMTSDEFADFSLEKAGVALLPGNNFGQCGEGYVRICYVNSLDNIKKAISALDSALRDKR
ncbi:pyridoxal phosphate-dependent aminotransferase [Marinomonas sp. C2222]|uniref:Aminotransferase n=1 Tax=Marinomonas sargassi TaxID=2984494 RepID=A0ABT2YP79_9GAMM|nr:pyridoxal phosphate-dependent aminotransferase [Marinomonas sargassi]MCV2401641.1 pyridoxal phosphate-dependent aminotransferase [Marinomonas sargassi]